MVQNRRSKVLLFLILLLVLAIPTGIALASRPNAASAAPSVFNKLSPSSGFSTTSTSVTIIWAASGGATGYQYCYDTIANNLCDTTWYSTGPSTTQVALNLVAGKTYYWQVRANVPPIFIEANDGIWWSFTIALIPTKTFTPGPFGKLSPPNGATGQSRTVQASWNAYANAVRYEYCYDTSNNSNCDNVNGWVSTGISRVVNFTNLAYSTTYYWQMRAVDANNIIVYPPNSWWSFTVMAPPPTITPTRTPAPNPSFFKSEPGNGYTTSLSMLTLRWSPSAGATLYQFCYDTINNNSCDTSWSSTGSTQGNTTTLLPRTTYYWQVRAVGPGGIVTEANGNGSFWWRFTKN